MKEPEVNRYLNTFLGVSAALLGGRDHSDDPTIPWAISATLLSLCVRPWVEMGNEEPQAQTQNPDKGKEKRSFFFQCRKARDPPGSRR